MNISVCTYVTFCDGKAEFSASLLQSSVSHDPSKSFVCAQVRTAFI